MAAVDPDASSFGSRLRKRRREFGLTIDAVARGGGMAPDTVRKIESDRRAPGKSAAVALAEGTHGALLEPFVWFVLDDRPDDLESLYYAKQFQERQAEFLAICQDLLANGVADDVIALIGEMARVPEIMADQLNRHGAKVASGPLELAVIARIFARKASSAAPDLLKLFVTTSSRELRVTILKIIFLAVSVDARQIPHVAESFNVAWESEGAQLRKYRRRAVMIVRAIVAGYERAEALAENALEDADRLESLLDRFAKEIVDLRNEVLAQEEGLAGDPKILDVLVQATMRAWAHPETLSELLLDETFRSDYEKLRKSAKQSVTLALGQLTRVYASTADWHVAASLLRAGLAQNGAVCELHKAVVSEAARLRSCFEKLLLDAFHAQVREFAKNPVVDRVQMRMLTKNILHNVREVLDQVPGSPKGAPGWGYAQLAGESRL